MTMHEPETEQQLTIDDILNEQQEVAYHSLLEVWREVLRPAVTEQAKKITPQWANRICSSYREVFFHDIPAFRDRYFAHILELAAILNLEIAEDFECLNVTSPEEDLELNSERYMNVLINWQRAFLQWELDWNTEDPHAAVELAAISETHKMFFDQTGLITLLDQINFTLTEADQEMLAQALQGLREQGD